jgi:hypothetical protein
MTENKTIKRLIEYSKNGYKFNLVKRLRDNAIFKGTRTDHGEQSETFEVIMIQSHNGLEIHGNKVPPSEFRPSDSQWGTKAWTFQSIEAANIKFNNILLK